MIENDDGEYFSCFKHLKAHAMPMVSGLNLQVAEMRDHIQQYAKSIFGAYRKLSRLEKAIASIQKDIKDLQQGEEEKQYHNNEKESKEMARK